MKTETNMRLAFVKAALASKVNSKLVRTIARCHDRGAGVVYWPRGRRFQ